MKLIQLLYVSTAVFCAVALAVVVTIVLTMSPAKADYRLTMIDMDTEIEFGSEHFIAYSDCRKRGLSNIDLLSAYTNRVGFVCPPSGEGQ